MHQLRLFVLSFLLLVACSNIGSKNHSTVVGMFTPHVLFPIKYHGQIKKLNERLYLAKVVNGKVLIDRSLSDSDRNIFGWSNNFEAHFNPQGIVEQCDILDGEGRLLQMYRNQMKDGKVVKFDIVENDTLRKYLNFFYDERGFIDRIKSYDHPGNTFQGTEDFTTDENGNISFIQFFDVEGQPGMKFFMDIDKMGRRTGYKQLDGTGKKVLETNVVYNNNGFIETKTEVNETGKASIAKYEYQYDEKGNWIQCILNAPGYKILITRSYEYWAAE